MQEGDLEIISTPIDALGVNYYHGEHVSSTPVEVETGGQAPTERPTRSPFPAAETVHWHPQELETTSMGWEIEPWLLRDLLRRVDREYTGPAGTAIWVTENGAAFVDELVDGAVHDEGRTRFLTGHLEAILDTIADGVDVRGYFYWSLLDNYEWAWGYHKRFGIVRVDYDTQERIVKDSGLAYRDVIAARALPARD